MTVAGVALSSSDKLLNIVSQEQRNRTTQVHNKMNNFTVPALTATSKSQKGRKNVVYTKASVLLLKATVTPTSTRTRLSFPTTFKVIISDIFI